MTGGGVVYENDTSEGLAEAMALLLKDNGKRLSLRESGISSLEGELSPAKMKERIRAVYVSIVDSRKG